MGIITREEKTNDLRWCLDATGNKFLQQCTIITNHLTGEVVTKKWRNIPTITSEQYLNELNEE